MPRQFGEAWTNVFVLSISRLANPLLSAGNPIAATVSPKRQNCLAFLSCRQLPSVIRANFSRSGHCRAARRRSWQPASLGSAPRTAGTKTSRSAPGRRTTSPPPRARRLWWSCCGQRGWRIIPTARSRMRTLKVIRTLLLPALARGFAVASSALMHGSEFLQFCVACVLRVSVRLGCVCCAQRR